MFTGIIEGIGKILGVSRSAGGATFKIGCGIKDYELGESIAVNGVCLTVTSFGGGWFTSDASLETLDRTNLSTLSDGSHVNIERALRLGDRLGGHMVSGHIDGTGIIENIVPKGSSIEMTVRAAIDIMKYVVSKGSVAIDGASLTVNRVNERDFSVMLIPHTQASLFDGFARWGRMVNIETDIIGRYVNKLMYCQRNDSGDIEPGLTLGRLRELGFA